MAHSVSVIHRTDKAREDGRAPVWIRVTIHRKSRYISTGVLVEPEHWNESKRVVRRTHELASKLNKTIEEVRREVQDAAYDFDSARAVKDAVTSDSKGLSAYLDQYIERLRSRDQYWERKKYNTTRNKLHGALGSNLSWDDLTPQALSQLERYCREERENNPNTTRKELVRLRALVNKAIREGVLGADKDPFRRFDIPSRVPTDRRSLTHEDIQALSGLDLPEGSREMRSCDAFILAFYGGGIRFSDVCQLRRSDISGSRLRYRMMKTDQVVSIDLPPVALDIVERWERIHDGQFLLPLLEKGDDRDPVHLRKRISSRNVQTNNDLKPLAKQAGIYKPEEVTFHVARHSFADVARKRSGDIYAISKALGHASLSVTESYLASFDQDAVDSLTNQMWSNK